MHDAGDNHALVGGPHLDPHWRGAVYGFFIGLFVGLLLLGYFDLASEPLGFLLILGSIWVASLVGFVLSATTDWFR